MKAILWDMDDTLLNTLPVRLRAMVHAHEVCLGQHLADPLAIFQRHHGETLESIARSIAGDDWRPFVAAYRDYCARDERVREPFDGVPEVLETFHEAGVPMGVVTSKIADGAVDELEKAGLLGYFGAVVCYDDTDRHKPEPEPIYAAMERLLIDDPGDVAYIGDSPADITAARTAGCLSIAALWGTLDRTGVLDAVPHAAAETPDQVGRIAYANAEGVR